MTTAPAQLYLIQVKRTEHTFLLEERSRLANAGSTTRYDEALDRTHWLVGEQVVAISEGAIGTHGRYWAVVALDAHQKALAADQLSNNEVSDDLELLQHFYKQGRIPRFDGLALLIERNRCRMDAHYEPLTEVFVQK